jgi:hypothetical protein
MLTEQGYKFHPVIHVSRLKLRHISPTRPVRVIKTTDTIDFDEALLPEDSWEPDNDAGDYEVEKIIDMRWIQPTRNGAKTREYLVKWKGYANTDNSWLKETELNCGALLYEYDQARIRHNRFQAAETADETEFNG